MSTIRRVQLGLGLLWTTLGIYWLTRGDDEFLGLAFLVLATATFVRAAFPEAKKVQWTFVAIAAVAGTTLFVGSLLANG